MGEAELVRKDHQGPGQGLASLSRQLQDQASERILEALLSILMTSHWTLSHPEQEKVK